ncbi:MAG: bifunctional diguanylate cyclase/phosphodiesterase [Bacillota bacterium]
MKIKNLSFKYKIISLVIAIIIILTATTIFIITNTTNEVLEDIVFQNQKKNNQQQSELVSNWFVERKRDLEIYANTEIMKNSTWNEKKNYLQNELANRVEEYYFFFLADESGNYSTTFEDNAGNISDRKYFNEIIKGKGKTVISDPVISKSTSRPIIVIGTAIEFDKNNGLIAAVIRLNELAAHINKYNNKEDGVYSFLMNNQGEVIAHPDQEKFEEYFVSGRNSSFYFPDEFENNIVLNDSGDFKFSIDNTEKHAFYHNIPETDNWKIVTVSPQNYLQRLINDLNKKIFSTAIIVILLGSLLSIYLANNISKPIIKLKNTFEKGATGNLDIRSDINSGDEIGKAADSFNKMMDVIKDLTYNDSLTGLPNIDFFKKKIDSIFHGLNDKNKRTYICSMGVDNFKSINDRFGHNGGDEILKSLADRLVKSLDENITVSRMSDEFYFYFLADEKETNNNKAYKKCSEILKKVNESYLIEDNIIHLSTSMGISVYPDDSKDVSKLIKNASIAMHAVKKISDKKIYFYSKNIEKTISQRKTIETELAAAINEEQFVLHFQPFISTTDEKVVGLEALIRWNHPKKGMISPGVFIPIAEETGFIKEIGAWVLKDACAQLKEMHKNINDDFFVSVNVSPEQFSEKNFIKQIKEILFTTGLEPEHLQLEITERTAMGNIEYTIRALQELQELGVKIAIDDFGTGYSSLSYLKEFAIDILKIDKSFIDNFIENNDDRAIVTTIINISHNLGLQVVAEGVENKEQANELKERLNCDIIQGYYYSKPLPLEKIIKNMDI